MSDSVLTAFLKMKPRESDADSVRIMTDPELRARLIMQIDQFPAVALPNRKNPVVIAGAVLSDEIAELWMVTGMGFETQLKSLVKQMKHLIKTAQEAFAPREIKLVVDPDRRGTERFVQSLGFVYEKRKAAHVFTLQPKGK